MGAIAPPQLGQKLNFIPKTLKFKRVLVTKYQIFSRLRRNSPQNADFAKVRAKNGRSFINLCIYV